MQFISDHWLHWGQKNEISHIGFQNRKKSENCANDWELARMDGQQTQMRVMQQLMLQMPAVMMIDQISNELWCNGV